MDPTLFKLIIEAGFAGLAIFLVWKTLVDKDRMATDARDQNKELVELIKNNTSAMVSVAEALHNRPCLRGAPQMERVGQVGVAHE